MIFHKLCQNVYKWFVDNKLLIHVGEDNIKCILFSKEKNLPVLKMRYDNNRIK